MGFPPPLPRGEDSRDLELKELNNGLPFPPVNTHNRYINLELNREP
jgi:hypothetical protein